MKLFNSLAIFSTVLSTALLALTGCGSSVIGGGGGAGGGSGGDGGSGGGGGNGGLCNGEPSSVSCEADGCPDGWTCTPDADPTTCHSSICSCEADGWLCTADCGMGGSTCQPSSGVITCNGDPSPLDCTIVGCPDGATCVPDPDPTTCHSSTCSCDPSNGWICTDDCQQNGSSCVTGL